MGPLQRFMKNAEDNDATITYPDGLTVKASEVGDWEALAIAAMKYDCTFSAHEGVATFQLVDGTKLQVNVDEGA